MDEVLYTDKPATIPNGSAASPPILESVHSESSVSESPQSRSEVSLNVESKNSRTVSDSSLENRRKSIIRDPSRKPGTTNKERIKIHRIPILSFFFFSPLRLIYIADKRFFLIYFLIRAKPLILSIFRYQRGAVFRERV